MKTKDPKTHPLAIPKKFDDFTGWSQIATSNAYGHLQNNKQEQNKVPFTQVD